MAARARLQVERKTIRQDREWSKNPQNPDGFEAKPRLLPDSTQDLLTWDCVIPGQAGTIWEGGRMPIILTFTEDYPQEGPKAQFKQMPGTNQPLFHPNVFSDGRVCLNLLKPQSQGGAWRPAHSVKMVLLAIQRLLDEPNNNDPAQAPAHALYKKNRAEYGQRVRQQMQLLKGTD